MNKTRIVMLALILMVIGVGTTASVAAAAPNTIEDFKCWRI